MRILKTDDGSSIPLAVDEDEKGMKGPKVELRNVWFKYPTRDVSVLRGFNMTVSSSYPTSDTYLIINRLRGASSPP